jgi:osmotically-inducible protein OsmY
LGARLDTTTIGVAIEDTLKRTTTVEAKGLQVTTVDGKVILRGTVHSLDARSPPRALPDRPPAHALGNFLTIG